MKDTFKHAQCGCGVYFMYNNNYMEGITVKVCPSCIVNVVEVLSDYIIRVPSDLPMFVDNPKGTVYHVIAIGDTVPHIYSHDAYKHANETIVVRPMFTGSLMQCQHYIRQYVQNIQNEKKKKNPPDSA